MPLTFEDLRLGNETRQAKWPGADTVDLAFRALEVCGEAGEVCEALAEIAVGRANSDYVLPEIADTIIAIDLMAMDLGLELGSGRIASRMGEDTAYRLYNVPALRISRAALKMAEAAKKATRRHRGIAGSTKTDEEVVGLARGVIVELLKLSGSLGVDVGEVIREKFNETSRRHGIDVTI